MEGEQLPHLHRSCADSTYSTEEARQRRKKREKRKVPAVCVIHPAEPQDFLPGPAAPQTLKVKLIDQQHQQRLNRLPPPEKQETSKIRNDSCLTTDITRTSEKWATPSLNLISWILQIQSTDLIAVSN